MIKLYFSLLTIFSWLSTFRLILTLPLLSVYTGIGIKKLYCLVGLKCRNSALLRGASRPFTGHPTRYDGGCRSPSPTRECSFLCIYRRAIERRLLFEFLQIL